MVHLVYASLSKVDLALEALCTPDYLRRATSTGYVFLQICAVENSSALPVDRKAIGQKSLEHIGIPKAFLSATF
jgi:hypothetical protein